MDVRMEHTAGRGRQAEVWIAGDLLTVCDGISAASAPTPPGVLEAAAFSYVTESPVPLSQTRAENLHRKRALEPLGGWAYLGFGQVVELMPVVIDFGIMRMQDPNWTTDESLIGQYVCVRIDRLEIVPVPEEP